MDYSKYVCSWGEKCKCMLIAVGISAILAWLFYRSCWGMVLLPVVYIFCKKTYKEEQIERRKKRLLQEFKDVLQALSAAMLAGYSVENAWRDVERTLAKMYGADSLMLAEVKRINASLAMNQPIERLLEEFAGRSACEEIESFAEVFAFAKRSGGDFVKIMRTTVQKIIGRMEVEQEIDTVLAGKKFEGNVMNVMPVLILAYMTISAGDFLDVLYGNVMGILIMTAVLIGYVLAWRLSVRILSIRL